jgi:hypothetical protein
MALQHWPAVAFGAGRASAPARRPAVACALIVLGRFRPPPAVSSEFAVSHVREPGTAERESAGRRPEGDRRMPGTRPWCSRRQRSPARPPVRDLSCSEVHVILGPRCAREGAYRWETRFGDHGTRGQSFRRLRFGHRHVASSSAMTGSATRASENQQQRQRQRTV